MRFNVSNLWIALIASSFLVVSACEKNKVIKSVKKVSVTVDANEATPITSGVNHIGLTVKDLEASTSFFVDTLGWKVAGGRPTYPAIFVTDGAIFVTLWQAIDPDTAIDFNRKTNVGLHHLALNVADVETLGELHEVLKADPNVRVEFGPQLNGKGPTVHMMVYEPSGSRIEFAVKGGRRRGDE